MDEEKLVQPELNLEDAEAQEGQEAPAQEPVEEYPNRKAFAGKFGKRHKDIDFEDKEARWGALSEDADRLDRYEESGRALSGVFEKHRWMASMVEDLRDNDDLDPITWMADNGIDIGEALDDPEYRSEISERIAKYQETQLKGEEAEREREENLQASADALESLGLSDDENTEMWNHFFQDVLDPALRGEVSAETWKMLQKARNYDSDVASAGERGAMQARNEKIRNKMKSSEGEVPPTLSQGGGERVSPKQKSKRNSFFEDLM